LAALVFAVVASRVGPRLGMTVVGALGGLLVSTGLLVTLTLVRLTPDYVGTFLPGQIIGGAGVGLAMPAFTAAAVSAVPVARFATAIGISSMFRQVGAALGVAALVAILGTPSRDTALAAFRHGWVFMAAAAAVGGILMASARFVPRPAAVSTTRRAVVGIDRPSVAR
jgi:hypothetical protein